VVHLPELLYRSAWMMVALVREEVLEERQMMGCFRAWMPDEVGVDLLRLQ
jgi:hypothetical protein